MILIIGSKKQMISLRSTCFTPSELIRYRENVCFCNQLPAEDIRHMWLPLLVTISLVIALVVCGILCNERHKGVHKKVLVNLTFLD